eukprot:COSAG02_NODE_5983_length_3891_cov_1159.797732_2_plen_56_part_00
MDVKELILEFIGQPAVHFSPTIAALTGASSRGLAQLSVTDRDAMGRHFTATALHH